jgi:predicted amidohydrolase
MRIACLQFAPQVGDVDNNLNRADAVLSKANPKDLDLLVLPELAFTGYNFKSLQHISPYLEPTAAGITSLWARTTALKYDCVVTVGYPEKVDITPKWPASPEYYNSAITVNADGETIANYRKSFLYYTDETWALEGPDGFYDGEIDGLGNVAMGICKWPTKSFERMDLNPYKFEAPWSAWEFAYHILHKEANLVILSMAWLTREDARSYSRTPKEPDMDTLSYWLARLEPLIRAETEGEIIVVLANRCGTEEDAVYAGTSAVLGIQGGEVKVYGILGRGEKELLVVDTEKGPKAKLISEPNATGGTGAENRTSDISNPSTSSEKSGKSEASKKSVESALTVDTKTSRRTSPSPPSPEAMEFSIDEIMSPISPVDARSPTSFFSKGPKTDGEPRKEILKSSIEVEFQHAKPDSPTFVRPQSPKSRNASRNRQPVYQEPALVNHDLAHESQVLRAAGVKSPQKSPPHSAGAETRPRETSPTTGGLFPREQHTSPRPKSTVW